MKIFKLFLTGGSILLMLSGIVSAQAVWNYIYYVPHVVTGPEYYPANHGYTNLIVTATEDGTNFEVDQDADGIYESQYAGVSAGTVHNFYRTNWPSPSGILTTGASVRSNEPLLAVLHLHINDFGTYDAGLMDTSLIPTYKWGNQFTVPVSSTYVYVFADSLTQVDIIPPGHPASTYTIQPRTNIKLSNIPSGSKILADNNVYILGVNCQPDQNYPWMYNVLPLSEIGTDYYHDANYGSYDITRPWPTAPKIWITAVNPGTNVLIDENKDGSPEYNFYLNEGESEVYSNPHEGAHIWSSDKIYIVHVENWAAPFRGKFGGAATEYIPTSFYGNIYALYDYEGGRLFIDYNPRIFIVAPEDDTLVSLDFNFDGVDQTNILNKGGVWTVVWPQGIGKTALVTSSKRVQVIYRTDTAHWDHPGVNVAYTAIPLPTTPEAIPGTGIFVDPSNVKRKWKIEIVPEGDVLAPGSPAEIRFYDITEDLNAEDLFTISVNNITSTLEIFNKTNNSFETLPTYSKEEKVNLFDLIWAIIQEIVVGLKAPGFSISFGAWAITPTSEMMCSFYPSLNMFGITGCKDDMHLKGICPVDFEVKDPKGRMLGKYINEIPLSSYLELDFNNDGELDVEIGIPDPIYGRYKIVAIPKDGVSEEDEFSFEAELGEIRFQLARDVQIKDIPVNPYRISFSNTTIPGVLDIDPNTLNLKSEGKYITCYIELPLEYNVGEIDPLSIILTADGESIIEVERSAPYKIGDYDKDGIPDLMVKFSRNKIKSIVSIGKNTFLCKGALTNDMLFIVFDTIIVK